MQKPIYASDNMRDRYWIIEGQSNAIGSDGQAADYAEVTDIAVNPNVLIHNTLNVGGTLTTLNGTIINDGEGVFEPWDLTAVPIQHSGNGSTRLAPNTLFYWADQLQKITGDRIHCIVVGWGNRGVDDFIQNGTNNNIGWLDLNARLESLNLPDGAIEGIIWSQGEFDDSRWSTRGLLYSERFFTWRREVSAMAGINDSTPTYIVQPTDAESFFIVDEFFNFLPQNEDYPFIILPTRGLAGDVHFTSLSYQTIGRDLMSTAWAEQEGFSSSSSLDISVRVEPTSDPESDFDVTVDFDGSSLFFSDDLITWTQIQGATTPYIETIPRLNNKRFYKSSN